MFVREREWGCPSSPPKSIGFMKPFSECDWISREYEMGTPVYTLSRWWFQYFLFSSLVGKMMQFDWETTNQISKMSSKWKLIQHFGVT